MALRGIGALTRAERDELRASLPDVFLWQLEGLSRAERVISFLEDLPITQGALVGQKLTLRPWQREWIEAVYATDTDGHRPVRTALLSVARKQGKTAIAAGLALCHLLGPEAEPRGEVYAAANDKNQAGKLFEEMAAIIRVVPHFAYRCNVTKFRKIIEVLEGDGDGSVFAALSADAETKHGLSPSFVVVDEYGQAKSAALFEALDTAQGARAEPLMVVISTQAASDDAPFSQLVDYGLKIERGEIEDASFHGALFAAPLDADIYDPEVWKLANPALGDFRSLEDVARQAEQARRIPSKEHAFRNLILNQRVDAHVRFLSASEWDANGGAVGPSEGATCYGGLDLSASRDLTAFVLVFPDHAGGYDVLAHFFLPADGLRERSEQDRVPYDQWARDGFLTAVPGPVIDPAYVAATVAEAAATYDIRAIAYDRWRIELFKKELAKTGAAVDLEPHGQGFRDMAPAVDILERLVVERKLRHGAHPVLRMCAGNAVVTLDAAGNRKLDKGKANGRIDGLVSLAMALTVADRGVQKFEPRLVIIQ